VLLAQKTAPESMERRALALANSKPANGTWGTGDRAVTVGNIADHVSPGLGKAADDRWTAKQQTDAAPPRHPG
jgi:hypothetical protein